jgi:carboxymethylenebutenolidase
VHESSDVEVIGDRDAPAVLLLHPWWGVTPAVRWWAHQLVAAGRRVVLPDLYGGRKAETIEAAEALEASLDRDEAARAIDRYADELAAEGREWAAMGFSMGAFFACQLAGRGAAGPRELVLFYGGQPPHGDVRTHLVTIHVVPDDEYFTEAELTLTEETFRQHGTVVDVYLYYESRHWFAERGSPGYDEEAADLARSRVVDQLGQRTQLGQ